MSISSVQGHHFQYQCGQYLKSNTNFGSASVIIIRPTSQWNTAQVETGCVDLGHLNSYNLLYGCSHYWLFTCSHLTLPSSYSHMWTATTERLSTPWVYLSPSCLTASFFSLLSLPVHQYPLQDQTFTFTPLPLLYSSHCLYPVPTASTKRPVGI